jgi:hypothetical protein
MRQPVVLDWNGHELKEDDGKWVHRYVLTYPTDSKPTVEVLVDVGVGLEGELPLEAIEGPMVRHRRGQWITLATEFRDGGVRVKEWDPVEKRWFTRTELMTRMKEQR